ncbi:MAG: hypothetical protein QY323_04290 [Patescibacteria group bacterium]|nr:MAG: hypothetical protein QY323_04290 [Patescibacteria group bacterium]
MRCLSHTLELRAYLARSPAAWENPLIRMVLEDLESFISRVADGRFTLRPLDVAKSRLGDIKSTLSSISRTDASEIEVSFQSLDALINKGPEEQMLIYSVTCGSVGKVLQGMMIQRREPTPFHELNVECEGFGTVWNGRPRTFEDLVVGALLRGGLREVLYDSRYGGCVPIFERDIALHFCWLFSFAYEKNAPRVEGQLPLTKMFRSNMPIGRYPRDYSEPERWLVFTE